MGEWGSRYGKGGGDGIGFDQGDLAGLKKSVGGNSAPLKSNYFSQAVTIPADTREVGILNVTLDPSISPVWTVVVLGQVLQGSPSVPGMALGRLYLSGGSGGGLESAAIPFDPQSVTILTVPASYVRVTIDTTVERIPGTGILGSGVFSAYVVPNAIGRGQGAFYTEWTGTIAPGATGRAGFVAANRPLAASVDAISVLPSSDAIIGPANPGAYTILIGGSALFGSQTEWRVPAGPSMSIPLWIPQQSGLEGIVNVVNNSLAPARYVVIYRLRI